MKVLIACEESQRVCKAFREKGHEAYSCDIQKCTGGHPEWHILDNALFVLNGGGLMKLQTGMWLDIDKWDLIIAHPPCTYLSNVNTRGHSRKKTPENRIIGNTLERISGSDFFMKCITANCDKIAVENPVGIMNTLYRQPDQVIEPYQFADSMESDEYVTKRTCLWLKGLPLLVGNDLPKPDNRELWGTFANGKAKTWEDTYSRDGVVRSKTFLGIAQAMADQWG